MRRALVLLVVLLFPSLVAALARASAFPSSVPLPVDFQPEGIALGDGSTFYVGSLRSGDIYRGDLRSGEGGVLVHAPSRAVSVGMKVDRAHGLLFVAGGPTGNVYVYSTAIGATVAVLAPR